MRFNIALTLLFLLQTVASGYYITDYTLSNNSFLASAFYPLEIFFSWVYSTVSSYILNLSTKTVTLNALVFTVKFLLLIALFVIIRGGVPRYRYDFLTKIG
jgi:NADH:ubiquinone oxidoreductase subunit H